MRKLAVDEELWEVAKKSPSLKKLRTLKEKMIAELEEQERQAQNASDFVVPLTLANEYRPNKDRSKGRGSPVDRRWDAPTNRSGARGTLPADSSSEKERRELEAENTRLRDIINLRRECSIRQETACQKEIEDLKMRLDATVVSSFDSTPESVMGQLRGLNGAIQENVTQLRGTIEDQAEVEKMNVIRTFRVKMHELKKHLAEEKHTNYTGAQEWIEKNKVLQHELDVATKDMERLRDKNRALVGDNKDLKIARLKQDRDRDAIVKSISVVKKENDRLADQIEKLQYHTIQLAKRRAGAPVGTLGSPSGPRVPTGTLANSQGPQAMPGLQTSSTVQQRLPSERQSPLPGQQGASTAKTDKERKYMDAIGKVKRVLAQDRKELKTERGRHMALLAQRTELEIFLRQCIDDVRKEIQRNSTMLLKSNTPTAESSMQDSDAQLTYYTVHDRKRIVSILLSKERILLLLYEKCFTHKHHLIEAEREAGNLAGGAQGAHLQQAHAALASADADATAANTTGGTAVGGSSGAGTSGLPGLGNGNTHADLDQHQLWAKWKTWTDQNKPTG